MVNQVHDAPRTLDARHRDQLAASAIEPAIIAERGYYSATRKVDLKRLGFGAAQCNVPALVIPIYDVHGEL